MSARVAELEAELGEIAHAEARLRHRRREINETIDAINLEARPIYPTAEQRAGIRVAARRVREGYRPSSHHGDPCGPDSAPYSSSVDVAAFERGGRGDYRVGVDHRAPYSRRRTGGKLWRFTDAEVDAIVALLEDEGLEVVDQWTHDQGVSIVVRAAS